VPSGKLLSVAVYDMKIYSMQVVIINLGIGYTPRVYPIPRLIMTTCMLTSFQHTHRVAQFMIFYKFQIYALRISVGHSLPPLRLLIQPSGKVFPSSFLPLYFSYYGYIYGHCLFFSDILTLLSRVPTYTLIYFKFNVQKR